MKKHCRQISRWPAFPTKAEEIHPGISLEQFWRMLSYAVLRLLGKVPWTE